MATWYAQTGISKSAAVTGKPTAAAPNSFVNGNAVVFKKRIDLNDETYVQNDVVRLIDVPAGFYCVGVGVNVITLCATLDDVDFGDGDTVDGFQDGLTFATAGLKVSGNGLGAGAYVEGGGKMYIAADTIDMKINTAAPTTAGIAVFDVWAFGFMAE